MQANVKKIFQEEKKNKTKKPHRRNEIKNATNKYKNWNLVLAPKLNSLL